MKFICAGLMKTGTKSIAKALTTLGFKVWDFDDQFLHHGDEWYDLYYKDKVPDFYAMFKDVDVVIDFPASFFFEELMEAFPDAKVILSERNDEDSWVKSARNQMEIFHHSFLIRFRYLLPTYNKYVLVAYAELNACLGTVDPNATYIYRKRYNWHNDRVKAVVPQDKLLVYRVEQEWDPLCKFTGTKIPDEPFPHTNVKGSISKTFLIDTEFGRKITREARFVKICFSCLVVVLSVLVYYYVMQ